MKKAWPTKIKQNWRVYHTIGLLLIIGLAVFLIWSRPESSPSSAPHASGAGRSRPATKSTEAPAKAHSYDYAASLDAVVNKGRVLPSSYTPAKFGSHGLRPEAGAALDKLFAAAQQASLPMKLTSGYRSYSAQTTVYNGYVSSYGQAQADTFSARPGHSEHQTGLAADVEPADGHCQLDVCFGDTTEGKWLLANAYRYGFIVRYQKGQQGQTGYQYEPWHIRYVGGTTAAALQKSGQTLEQYFGLPAYLNYPKTSFQLKS